MGSKSATPPPPLPWAGKPSKKKQPPKPSATQPKPSATQPKPLAFTPRARAPRLPSPAAAIAAAQAASPPPNHRSRRIPLIGACFVGAGIAFYIASLGYSLANPYVPTHPVPADTSDRYDATAARFDEFVGGTEKGIGINRLRKKMVSQARGDVLEVSAGTGRNTSFYDWGRVRSLVLLDRSGPMLEVARRKWEEERTEREKKSKAMVGVREKIGDVEFRAQSALERIEGPKGVKADSKDGEAGKFDTIVQTMGLCSTSEPEKLLQRMAEVVKRDGKILLLEHGKASYDWLNNFLDKAAPGHADKHGCWWNKDIGAIVEKSGLEVVQISRPWYHLGTTWWVELRRDLKAEAEAETATRGLPASGALPSGKSSWWGVWRSS